MSAFNKCEAVVYMYLYTQIEFVERHRFSLPIWNAIASKALYFPMGMAQCVRFFFVYKFRRRPVNRVTIFFFFGAR